MYDLLINAVQLRAGLAQPGWLVFDVRHDLSDHDAGRRAYEQGHVPGAIYLDHERELSAPRTGSNGRHPLPSREEFGALMRRCGLVPGVQAVVYDEGNSMFAAHFWWMLRWLGHREVAVLDGGWTAWREAGGKVETGANAGSPAVGHGGDYGAMPAMPTVDACKVLANIAKPEFTVVDARAPARFRGEVEPLDPVAGHIPGALNRPNSLNVGPDGRFRPAEELRAEFRRLLGDVAPDRVVHQCGSGITACHNLFAMEVAGLHGSSLYPGSWSEWCSDPSRPVATGE